MSDTTLRLQTNVPETVALQFADGLPVSSNFGGDQIMFSLTDGRKMYLPPIVADKITAARVAVGQPFTICKREIKNGNRRMIEYQVEAGAFSENAPAVAKSAPAMESVAAPAAPSYATGRGLHVVGNNAAVAAPAPVAMSSAFDANAVALMKIAGRGAIDAVLDIEQYAQSRGMTDFVFGADNVQKIAACLFIEISKRAGRA